MTSPQLAYYRRNRERILEQKRQAYQDNLEDSRARGRAKSPKYHLKSRYGLTVEARDLLFEGQGSCCAICGDTEPSGQGWCVDHDHETGQIRGILCHFCNSMLGYAKDDPQRLLAGAEYLERSRSG